MNNLFTYEKFIVEKKTTHHPFHGSLNREERNEFIEKLQKNIVIFRYKKRDGSIRKAEGTLHPKFLPPPKSDQEFVRPEYQIVYYDLEKKSWRSFRSFEFVEILSTRPALSKHEDEEEKKKKLKEREEEETKKVKKEKNIEKDDDAKKEDKVDEKDEDVKDEDKVDEKDDVKDDKEKEEIDDRDKGEILKDRRKKKENDD